MKHSILKLLVLACVISLASQASTGYAGSRPRPLLLHGSGRWWRVLEAAAGDGTGPGYIVVQVATPIQGPHEYDITVLDRWEENPNPVGYARFKGSIRFTKLEGFQNPANDDWDEKGQSYKQFPHALVVGHGIEHELPVTLVWTCGEQEHYRVTEIARVFDGDASSLGGADRGSKIKGGILVEHAKASWLSKQDRPSWAKRNQRLKRTWIYGIDNFRHGDWKRD